MAGKTYRPVWYMADTDTGILTIPVNSLIVNTTTKMVLIYKDVTDVLSTTTLADFIENFTDNYDFVGAGTNGSKQTNRIINIMTAGQTEITTNFIFDGAEAMLFKNGLYMDHLYYTYVNDATGTIFTLNDGAIEGDKLTIVYYDKYEPVS